MKQGDINYSTPGFPVIEELASGIISALCGFSSATRKDQEKKALEIARKRSMQDQNRCDPIDSMPFETKYWVRSLHG